MHGFSLRIFFIYAFVPLLVIRGCLDSLHVNVIDFSMFALCDCFFNSSIAKKSSD